MKIQVPELVVSKEEGFSERVDIFNRKPFGESLYNVVINTDDRLVIAIDSAWGEGKTTFIKMWQGLLYEKEVPSIYFDAFENDYYEDAFLALCSQIYNKIQKDDPSQIEGFSEKASSVAKVVGRVGLKVGVRALTSGLVDESALQEGQLPSEISGLVDGYFRESLESASKDSERINAFKDYLEELPNNVFGSERMVIIIDELDRCRPKLALSIIETVKHFFSVPNISFILVMNRSQLEESVRAENGQGVDAHRYLHKFISLWTTIPSGNIRDRSVRSQYVKYCLQQMDYKKSLGSSNDPIQLFIDVIEFFELSLREIERVLTNFAVVNNAIDRNLKEEYEIVLCFLCVLKVINPALYERVSQGKVGYSELVKGSGLDKLKVDWWGGSPEGHPVKFILRCAMSSHEEIAELVQEHSVKRPDFGFSEDVTVKVCSWLDSFEHK